VPDRVFDERARLPGFDIDEAKVRATLAELGRYGAEASWPRQARLPGEYTTANDNFGFSSAALLHSFIRANGTRKVIEIGGGYSSLVSLPALERNHGADNYQFVCVEPYPTEWLRKTLSDRTPSSQLIQRPVEQLDPSLLADLAPNDILFIDSSHCVRLASDVNFLYLQVLPRLKPGVLVHIHDIYIPYEYPRVHFFGQNKMFWNEQYLLEALLTENPHWEVVLPGFMVQKDMERDFQNAFPHYDPQHDRKTSSFWMRRLA